MSIDMPDKTAAHSLACHHCGQVNSAARKFCGACGEQLWQECAACSARSPVGVQFCGDCGAKLAEARVDRLGEFERELEEAALLLDESRFEEAETLLVRMLGAVNRGQFPSIAQQVDAQVLRVQHERDRRTHDAQAALDAAQLYLNDSDYDRARCALESVAEPLRTEDHAELLTEVHARLHEIAALELEIRRSIQDRQTANLLPKVERLLALQPHHPDAPKLAQKLRDKQRADELGLRERLCRAAKGSVAEFDYDQALEQLKLVPPSVRDEDFEKLHDYVTELAWLMSNLRNAPVVDPPLVEAARRLVKLQPMHPQASELLIEMKRRLAGELSDPRQAAPAWARPPKRTPLGVPVEWLGGFGRLQPASAAVKQKLAQHPGRFSVAAGLALQALEEARINIDLRPEEKTGLLGRLGQLKRPKPPRSAWGIDLGPTCIKAVKLGFAADSATAGASIEIQACELIDHEKNLSRPDAEGMRDEIVAAELQEIFAKHEVDVATERFCLGMPGGKSLGRFFRLPAVKQNKLADAMPYEVTHQIPLPLETLAWDYHLLNPPDGDPAPGDMYDIVLLAAKKTDLQEHLQPFLAQGMQIFAVQSDCLALYNLLQFEFWDAAGAAGETSPQENTDAVMLLDLGSEATSVLIASPGSVWFRTVPRGGDDFTKRLMRQFNLTFDRAEQVKRNPSLSRSLSKLHATLVPAFQELEKELQMSFSSFAAHLANTGRAETVQLNRLLGLGGGFQLHSLLRYLRTGR